jgi:hypothetical protein
VCILSSQNQSSTFKIVEILAEQQSPSPSSYKHQTVICDPLSTKHLSSNISGHRRYTGEVNQKERDGRIAGGKDWGAQLPAMK